MTDIKAKELNRVYLRDLRGGKSPAAHYADLIVLMLLLGAAVYLQVRLRFAARGAAMSITAMIAIIMLVFAVLIERIRLERRIPKVRKRASEKLMQNKLLADRAAINEFLELSGVKAAGSVEALTADDVIEAALAGKKTVVYYGDPTPKAQELMKYYGICSVSFIDLLPQERLELYAPDESEIDEALIKEGRKIKERREKRKLIRPLSRFAAFRYICVGILLLLLSFVVRARLYYRLVASASLFLGTALLAAERAGALLRIKQKPPAQ